MSLSSAEVHHFHCEILGNQRDVVNSEKIEYFPLSSGNCARTKFPLNQVVSNKKSIPSNRKRLLCDRKPVLVNRKRVLCDRNSVLFIRR